MKLKVRNWKKFQHYKKRNPPWIRLYKELLNDPDWHALSPAEAKVLIMLWMLACEDEKMEGSLPAIKVIAFRLRIASNLLAECLQGLSPWIEGVQEHLDSKALAERYQDATPETEAETELLAKEKENKVGVWRLDEEFISDTFGMMVHSETGEVRDAS